MSKFLAGMKKSNGWLVVVVFFVILVLWVSSVFVVPFAASKYFGFESCDEASETSVVPGAGSSCSDRKQVAFGTFGDSFGAINALFSGLALAGVVLTLYFHAEGAKRQAKPFLVLRLGRSDSEARTAVGPPNRQDAMVTLPLNINLPLNNASPNPALNVKVEFSLLDTVASAVHVVEVPLTSSDRTVCGVCLRVTGNDASSFVQSVCGAGAVVEIKATCESVEGVNWLSSARYRLKVNPNRPDDVQMLNDAIRGAAGENLWDVASIVDLEAELVSDSWLYKEV